MVLAFGVGILVGGRACAPEPETETITETVVREGPERIVYECPPDVGVIGPKQPQKPGVEAIQTSTTKALPDAPKPISPRKRQRLLAWVRDQSADLEGCRPSAKETYRLAVTLVLNDEGAVQRVRLNAPRAEIPSNVRGCLRKRMTRWEPPAELVEGRRELVFGLTF